MSEPTFKISPLKDAVKTVVKQQSYLSDIPCFTEEIGDIENEIARSLGMLTETMGKLGICVVVLSPVVNVNPGPGPVVTTNLTLAVLENVVINHSDSGTKKNALDVAEYLLRVFHHRQMSDIHGALSAAANAIAMKNSAPLEYHVNLQCKFALKPENT